MHARSRWCNACGAASDTVVRVRSCATVAYNRRSMLAAAIVGARAVLRVNSCLVARVCVNPPVWLHVWLLGFNLQGCCLTFSAHTVAV